MIVFTSTLTCQYTDAQSCFMSRIYDSLIVEESVCFQLLSNWLLILNL